MSFTDAEIAQYEEQGYLQGPRVLSDEQIVALQLHIDAILDGHDREHGHLQHHQKDTVSWNL